MQASSFNLLEYAQRIEKLEKQVDELKANQQNVNSTEPLVDSQDEFCRRMGITPPTLRKGERQGYYVRMMLSDGRIGYDVRENMERLKSKNR